MNFLHERVFDPILASKEAPANIKAGVNLTIGRMNRLPAEKMIQYYKNSLFKKNSVKFSKLKKSAELPRFEDVLEEFRDRFNDEWLRA